MAFLCGNIEAATELLNNKANLEARDRYGRNVIHLALKRVSKTLVPDCDHLLRLISLIPKDARVDIFSQTSQDASIFGNPSSSSSREKVLVFTPLSYWISKLPASGSRSELEPKILELLIANGAKSSLRQYDGNGFPLHQVIKASFPSLARVIINEDPAVLFLEDTTGMTPYELSVRCLLNRPSCRPPIDREEIWEMFDTLTIWSICQNDGEYKAFKRIPIRGSPEHKDSSELVTSFLIDELEDLLEDPGF